MKLNDVKRVISLVCAMSLVITAASCNSKANTVTDITSSAENGAVTSPALIVTETQTSSEQSAETDVEVVSPPYEPEITDPIYIDITGDADNGIITPDTKEITVTVNCATDEQVTVSTGYFLRKMVNGEPEEMPLKEGTVIACGEVVVSPDNPYSFVIHTDDHTEPLKLLGDYMLSVECNGKEYSTYFGVIGVTPELTESDIVMKLDKEHITTADKWVNLEYEYVGTAEYADYGFGCYYTLEKKDENGEWVQVEFSENAAFIDLGYLIGTVSPKQSTTVTLNDDNGFYKEPLTAGYYRVVKPITDDVTLYAEFEMTDENTAEDDYEIEEESGTLTLQILEKEADFFRCQLPWPYPAYYNVMCNTADYPDFCINDIIEVDFEPMYKTGDWEFKVIPTDIRASSFTLEENVAYKPVIYLYPEEETDISVKLDYNGRLTVTYPEYKEGWSITAKPDGTLTDADGKEYPYLFWEGENNFSPDFSEGFCVKGEDTKAFLNEKLSFLGLSEKERAEFTAFWLPHMINNEYNVISFQTDSYTDNAVLSVTPEPDCIIRVFMAYYPSDEKEYIPEQELTPTKRSGFTVVEWGGTLHKK